MEIRNGACLRSLLSESGRQSDFYHRRGDTHLGVMWGELEGLAWEATKQRNSLVIAVGEVSFHPIPINDGEQGQQPSNNKVIKAFQ